MVTPDFFKTFDIQSRKAAVSRNKTSMAARALPWLNENFARKFLPNVDPIGKRLLIEQLIPGVTKLGPPLEWAIVGVYHNVRSGGPRGDDYVEMTVPFYQSPWPSVGMAVRTASEPGAMTKSIASVISSMDSNLAMADIKNHGPDRE